jgi:uncharacterized protein (TIGR01777 family)
MRILITGGTGLIGKRLTTAFTQRGDETIILTRKSSHSSKSVHYVNWNGRAIPETVGPIDAIINLAGASIIDHPWTNAYKKIILESRLHATEACTAFINNAEHKPQVFVSASAVGYYGTQNPQIVDENGEPGKDFLAQTCLKWEQAAMKASVRTVITRIGIVMDKGEGAFPRLLAPFKFYAGGYLGNGKQGFPWIHIQDVTNLFLWILDIPTLEGPINLTAPEILTNRQFGAIVGKIIGKPSGLPVPALVVKAMLGERSMILLEGQFVKPQKALASGYTFLYPDAISAITELLKGREK